MDNLEDAFQRTINYMRISITDRCNLRCIYCTPQEGFKPFRHEDILRYEEIARISRIAAIHGVKKIRITGGEPLVRKDVSLLISMLKNIEEIKDISLTTNGILLSRYARELRASGLERVNISLDSLRANRYREITRGGNLDDVLRGIECAQKEGLTPIKINMVPIRGFNDDEIVEFAKITLNFPYQVRFIEFMPFGKETIWRHEYFISAQEIKSILENIIPLYPVKVWRSGPAKYYKIKGAKGLVGFISPLSNHFCRECNRLRLTSDGKLRPCLFSETEIDLKTPMRCGASDKEIGRLIKLSVQVKPIGHNIRIQNAEIKKLMDIKINNIRPMPKIGG